MNISAQRELTVYLRSVGIMHSGVYKSSHASMNLCWSLKALVMWDGRGRHTAGSSWPSSDSIRFGMEICFDGYFRYRLPEGLLCFGLDWGLFRSVRRIWVRFNGLLYFRPTDLMLFWGRLMLQTIQNEAVWKGCYTSNRPIWCFLEWLMFQAVQNEAVWKGCYT
jgi:hypothetical protein